MRTTLNSQCIQCSAKHSASAGSSPATAQGMLVIVATPQARTLRCRDGQGLALLHQLQVFRAFHSTMPLLGLSPTSIFPNMRNYLCVRPLTPVLSVIDKDLGSLFLLVSLVGVSFNKCVCFTQVSGRAVHDPGIFFSGVSQTNAYISFMTIEIALTLPLLS